MRGFISLIIIIIFTSVTYYGIGPLAESIEGAKEVPSHHFTCTDLPQLTLKGNATKGKTLVMGAGACIACHSIKVAGITSSMSPVMAAQTYGVIPPDLSNAGVIYSPKFLAAYIANPVHAMKLESKYNTKNGKIFPMPNFAGASGNIHQEIANMVAYFKSIAIKQDKLTPKMAFEDSCGRCHSMKFDKWTQVGQTPKFKNKRQRLEFALNVAKAQHSLYQYLGSMPPDLSTMALAKPTEFISTFIENPQNYIKGTAMPRVGVSASTAKKVIEYLKNTASPEHAERESLGRDIMIYLVIFAIFAYLWKRSIWKDLH